MIFSVLKCYTHYVGWKALENRPRISFNESTINVDFWNSMVNKEFDKVSLDQNLNILLPDGSVDLLATSFYFLNCLWERKSDAQTDKWGRSEFNSSIWKQNGFDQPYLKVNKLFDELSLKIGLDQPSVDSKVFLSHDIDAVYSSWMEDGFADVKSKRFGNFTKRILRKVVGINDWFNFRKIASIEKRFDMTSTFFWIPRKGKVPGIGRNADYQLNSEKFKNELNYLKEIGCENGLHKSIHADLISEEVELIPVPIIANRYHYLKFHFPELIKQMSKSNLTVDASLGYAEVMGYRNGYSLPFVPFDFETNQPAKFLEVPLTIMDGTFSSYQKMNAEDAWRKIKVFLEEHKQNAVISVLWHNTHFTNAKYYGYPELYGKVLNWFYENGIVSCDPQNLYKDYFYE